MTILENSEKKFIIELDKDFFDNIFIDDLLRKIRANELIKKACFEYKVMMISEDIKVDWWNRNGKEYLKDITNDK